MTTTVQSDVMSMSAGDEIDERFSLAVEAKWWLSDGPWPQPTALDRLRRLLGLPPPHPSIGNPTEYCGVAWSTNSNAVEDMMTYFGMSPPTSGALNITRWFICSVMSELEME